MSRLALSLLLAAAVSSPVRGAEPAAPAPRPLPFEDVLRGAAERAPLAAASVARRDASDASARKARRLPNPEATVRVENWRRGTDAHPFDAHADLDVVAELAQPLPVFGTWTSRRDEAAAMSRATRAVSRGEVEGVVLEAARLYLSAVRGRDLVGALAESRDVLGTMVATVEKRVAEGWSAEGDLLKLRAENARSEALLARATLELDDAAARLAALLGEETHVDPARLAMPQVPALPEGEPEALGRAAAATRPAVIEARERLEAARATLRLEKALRAPEPSLTAGYKRTGGLDTALAGISFPLPFFDTNATGVARAEADVRAAEAVLRSVELETAAGTAGLVRAARTFATRAEAARTDLLGSALGARGAARASFREGVSEVLPLVDAERVTAEAVRETLDLAVDARLATLAARLALGQEVFP
ncbi:MAG: TolC family protein [Holophagales bacterium]|nr:TolC family protein [Holophagales bacterium]